MVWGRSLLYRKIFCRDSPWNGSCLRWRYWWWELIHHVIVEPFVELGLHIFFYLETKEGQGLFYFEWTHQNPPSFPCPFVGSPQVCRSLHMNYKRNSIFLPFLIRESFPHTFNWPFNDLTASITFKSIFLKQALIAVKQRELHYLLVNFYIDCVA